MLPVCMTQLAEPVRVTDGGAKLAIRGYIGPFYRTQVWERTE